MSRDKESIEGKRREQSQKYDLKKNRISFKEFQQSYEEHVQSQKQKRKLQQENLNKLSSKNLKPLQESNRQNELNQCNQVRKFFNDQNQNLEIKLTTQNEQNTFSRISNIKSCFTSPKATSMNFIKSINLASNKSKQLLTGGHSKENLSNTKINEKAYGQSKRNNVTINLNVKPNSKNVDRKVSKDEKVQEFARLHSNHLRKNPSLSQMNTIELFEGSLKPCNQYFESNQPLLQYVSYLVAQLQFLNQFFKEIQPSSQKVQASYDTPSLPYKVKLLSQLKNKLGRYQQVSVDEKNPLKELFSNIVQLLQNYENDLKRLSVSMIPIQTNKKSKALQIVINDNENINFEHENRFKRQDSKKKTVKLSKSRRTNEQTLYTESIIHPFESSEFSILSTSKITDISRPSSQNKQKSQYYNQIENIINSKIMNHSVEKKVEIAKINAVKDQSQSRMKVLIKGASKNVNNSYIKGIPIKGIQNKCNILTQQGQTKSKVKSVTKTISLITNSKPQVIHHLSQDQHQQQQNKKTMKDIQKNRQKALSQQESKLNKVNTQNNYIPNKNFIPDTRQSFESHNESIFQLQYLESYQSQNCFHCDDANLAHNKMFVQIGGSNINWKQNKYGSKLFM